MVPIFNMGNPPRKQCAQRADGVWFVRHKRHNGPGFTGWLIAPFQHRPPYAWYAGKQGKLSNGNHRAKSGKNPQISRIDTGNTEQDS